jgi:outer membrane receptor protein involved in Fe transport
MKRRTFTKSMRRYSTCHKQIAGFWLLLVFVCSSAGIGLAQVLYGSLTGNITDPSGAVVPGANVVAVNVGTGVQRQKTANASGTYLFNDLLPGIYRVTISAPNFKTSVTENVHIDVNAVRRDDAELQIGQVQESVTVTAAPPELKTDRADVSTNLNLRELQSLPAISSEGRSFQALYKIIPGASLPAENNSAGGNPQRAMTANVNGQSSQGNNTRIDGVQDAYPWLPNNIAYVPPTDAIETVNVVTSSFDAEQGNVGGAAVNVQIKTGTNDFHGDLHEFHTDNALSNRNYFNPSTFRNPLNVFNQFGGAIGGPIVKNKLFFFGDYEQTRQNQAPAGNFQTVPFGGLTAAAAQNAGFFDFRSVLPAGVNIYDPTTGNADGTGRAIMSCNGVQNEICLNRVDPAALTMVSLIPAPNQPGATSNNYFVEQTGTFRRTDIDSKINYVASNKSSIFGRYSISRSDIFDPPALGTAGGNATLGGQNGNAFSRIQVVGLGGTYAFSPNLLLDVNSGFTRQRINAEDTDIAQDKAFGLNTLNIPGTNDCFTLNCTVGTGNQLYWGIPAFQFNTFSNLGNANTGNPFLFRDNQYVANSNITWVRGKHQLRFGIEYDHTQLNHFQPQGGSFQTARGSFQFTGAATELATCTGAAPKETCSAGAPSNSQFNSFADFLLGLPDQVGKAVQNANTIALRWSQFAWYARDQWQITPTLTVNYGLRWEYYPMAYSDIGGARVLDPTTMNVLVGGGSSGVPRDDGVNVGYGLFLPRLGIAWRPTEKTVVRAGYGMSADSNNWRFLRNSYPADTISTFTATTFPQAINSTFAPAGTLTGLNAGPAAAGPYTYLPVGITPVPVVPNAPGVIPLPNNVGTTTIPRDFRRGYINSFNLTLEREFAGFVGDVGYVGSRGIRPLTNMNINPAPAGGGTAGRLLNAQFGGTWGDINELNPFGNSYYDSLQTRLTRRFGDSQVGFVYTFSKAIDYEDNEEISFILFPYPAYLPRNKAVAGFDRTHNFQAYGLYELPFGHGKHFANSGIASALAGGWQVNWLLSAMSGTPFTITDSGSGASFLNAPGNTQTVNVVSPISIVHGQPASSCAAANLSCKYFNPASFQQVSAATPGLLDGFFGNAGRNILRGPGYFNLDMSLFRNFKISERFTFQFEADAFSVTNTPHFNNPNSNISGANFGAITSTLVTTNASLGGSGGQRQWWFGGKLIF